MKKKILNLLNLVDHNRFSVILPIVIVVVWLIAFGCTPMTASPMTGQLVAADMLKVEYDTMLSKFNIAAKDLEKQYEQQEMIMQIVTSLASGQVTTWGALGNMLIAGGGVGLLFDNRRKNTVITAMKRVKKIT